MSESSSSPIRFYTKHLKGLVILLITLSLAFVSVGILIIMENQDQDPGPIVVRKPNIYIYSDTWRHESLQISVTHGHITATLPKVSGYSSINWEFDLSKEGIYYQGSKIPYLFYEAVLSDSPELSDYGWTYQSSGNVIIFKQQELSYADFIVQFKAELLRVGLFDIEANDFVDYWFGDDKLLIPANGIYNLQILSSQWIAENLRISTLSNDYQYLRLLCYWSCNSTVELSLPPTANFIWNKTIHEWGVITE